MTSTIVNFIVERYLANFLEINTSQTTASIWSGIVEMQNLKIKPEIFQTMNLPYLELVNGYVGKLKLELQMPRFYLYPIKVYVDKVFFHARQKNIDKLNKDKEIEAMELYKQSQLTNVEQLNNQVSQLQNEGPGMVQQIMNNIQIIINDVVFRFDDAVSYPKIPYSLGMILGGIVIQTTRSDYKLPKDPNEQIPYKEINYKVIKIDNFSIFMDCYAKEEDIDYKKLIDQKVMDDIDNELKKFMKDQIDFYAYCMSEVYVHSHDKMSHEYLLHYLDMDLNVALNDNVKNKKPKYDASLIFPSLDFGLTLKQIETLFKVLAYINLNFYYQLGISKDYYTKKITEEEEKKYIEGYLNYYKQKYINKNDAFLLPDDLLKIENGLTYEQIQTMRSDALTQLDIVKKITDLEAEIKTEEGRWFGYDEVKIEQLKKELEKLKEKQKNISDKKNIEKKESKVEVDEYFDLPDEYVIYHASFKITTSIFTIYENMKQLSNKQWAFGRKLVDFIAEDFIIDGEIRKNGQLYKMSLLNCSISQDKVSNEDYDKILFGEKNEDKTSKVLYMEFEMNPKFEKSNYRFMMTTTRQLYLVINLYILQYINYKVMDAMNQNINFAEITSYASESVSKYIQEGYIDKFLGGDYQHFNIDLDITFNSPILLIPLNIMDKKNKKCIYLNCGKLIITTKLPPRQDLNIDYKTIKDPNLLYDDYIVRLEGIKMSTIENCTAKNNYIGNEEILVKDFDMEISCKMIIESENKNFDAMIIEINIPTFEFSISEFQILFMIDYLKSMYNEGNLLSKEMDDDLKKKGGVSKSTEMDDIKNYMKKKGDEVQKGIEKENEEKKKKEEEKKKIEEELKEKKKKKKYLNFVKKFAEVGKNTTARETSISDIEKMRKSFNFIFRIKKVALIMRKNYRDLSVNDYLIYQQNDYLMVFSTTDNSDMYFKLDISNIGLYDKDLSINKEKLINPHFDCLVESSQTDSQNINSFITILFCYIKSSNKSETIIDINNLNIVIGLDSILRLYQFSMYYYEKYCEMCGEVEKNNPNAERIREEEKKKNLEYIKKKQREKLNNKFFDKVKVVYENRSKASSIKDGKENEIKKDKKEGNKLQIIKEEEKESENETAPWMKLSRELTDNNEKENLKIKNQLKGLAAKKFLFGLRDTITKTEHVINVLKVTVNMNDTVLKMPLDASKIDTPIFSINFDMIYIQEWKQDITNVYEMPKKKLIKQDYKVNDSIMNVMFYDADMDLIYYVPSQNKFTQNLVTEKLLSNFRMTCQIKSYIVPENKIYVSNIDVLFEPLLLNFGFRQIRKLTQLYNDSMKFYYTDMQEKYVPYLKPEQIGIENGKNKLKENDRKPNLRNTIRRIIIKNKLQKHFTRRYKDIKLKLEKEDVRNISKFNNFLDVNVKIDKTSFTIFDNTTVRKKVLMDVGFNKLNLKYISNSKPRDKDNMGNAIIEIITATSIPMEQYNFQNLYQYMDMVFELEIYYYNLVLSDFEPFIEPFGMKINMLQVDPMTRNKMEITSKDMLNINISSNSMKVLNMFLTKYYQSEDLWKKLDLENQNVVKRDDENYKQKKEIILKLTNKLGLPMYFWFEANPKVKYEIKKGTSYNFTKNSLAEALGPSIIKNKILKDKFSFSFDNDVIISGINFSKNLIRQFNVKINQDGKIKDVEILIRVDTSGLIKEITFTCSILFLNHTKYDDIYIKINDDSIQDNCIHIKKKQRGPIPITWMLSKAEKPEISVSVYENGPSQKIYDNINELLVKKIDNKILDEREKKKKVFKKEHENDKNPTFKLVTDQILKNFDNNENSKITPVQDKEGNISYLCFDYKTYKSIEQELLSQKPEIEEEEEKKETNKVNGKTILKNPKDKRITDSYHYLIHIQNCVEFYNSLPFPLLIKKDEKEINLKPLNTEVFYDLVPQTSINNVKIILDYYNTKYESREFAIRDKIHHLTLYSNDENFPEITMHVAKVPTSKNLNVNTNLLKLDQFSTESLRYIFFFDYLITNRLNSNLYCLSTNNKKYEKEDDKRKPIILQKEKINLISFPQKDGKLMIKLDDTNWSNAFDFNTIGVEGVVKMDKKIEVIDDSKKKKDDLKVSMDVACLISNSENYLYSVVLVFEQRYLLINNLGFDVYYMQEGEEAGYNYYLKDKSQQDLIYTKEKRIYRIGIENPNNNNEINWSGPFDVENVEDFDLMIKIDKKEIDKYPKNIFTYNGEEYYILIRMINQTYDKGIIYIMLNIPHYPYLEIDNKTNSLVKIYESKNSEPLIINPRERVPFVWKSTIDLKDTLECEVYGSKKTFSFSKFDKNTYNISTQDPEYKEIEIVRAIILSVITKNLQNTRCLKIEESEYQPEDQTMIEKIFFRNKKRPTTMDINCDFKGMGLSIIDDIPKEVFYISMYGLKAGYKNNVLSLNNDSKIENTENMTFYMKNFQIDYCKNDSLKNIIYPKVQIIPSNEEKYENSNEEIVPFLSMLVVRQYTRNITTDEQVTKYPQIDITMQEFNIKVEQYEMNNLLYIMNDYMSLLDYYYNTEKKPEIVEEENLKEKIEIPITKLSRENENISKMLINFLLIGAIKFNLTLRLDLASFQSESIPKTLIRILGSIGNSFARISESPLKFTEKIFQNVYIDYYSLMWKLIGDYTKQGILQIYKILGSLDLIGNPVKLIDNIGTGFFELINEPRKGFVQGPTQFAKGLGRGIAGLLSGVVGGTFDAIGKITGTLYAATQSATGHTREAIVDEEDEPGNVLSGTAQGLIGGGKELLKGITGIFLNPYRKAKKQGVKGFFKGLGSGLLGAIISPVAAVLKITNSIAVGIKNTFKLLTKTTLKTERFRFPRVIVEGEPIKCYDEEAAEAKEALFRLMKIDTDNIIYNADFQSGDKGFDDKICTVILTDKLIVVVYDLSKVIFNVKLKHIKKCTLHFVNNVYVVVFKLDDESTKGFKLTNECGNIACSLYDLFTEMLDAKNLKTIKTLIKKQSTNMSTSMVNNINTNNTLRSGNINLDFSEQNIKSNYDNTIPNSGSVFNANSIPESEYSDAKSHVEQNEEDKKTDDNKLLMDKID